MPDKKYANRHWETNEENKYGCSIFELHFTEFYDDKEILRFTQNKDDAETYDYYSEFLNVEDGFVMADSIEEAMEQFEDMIIYRIEEDISNLEERLEKFKEET